MEEEISTVNIVDKDEQHGSKGGILFMAGKLKIAMLGDSVIIGTTPRKPLFIRVSRA